MYFYLFLDTLKIYLLPSRKNSPLSIYLQEGDKVVVIYYNTKELFLPVKEMEIEGVVSN